VFEVFAADVCASCDDVQGCGVVHIMTGREGLCSISDTTLYRTASVCSQTSSDVQFEGGLAGRDGRPQGEAQLQHLALLLYTCRAPKPDRIM
jgi:hypothetical protein